MKARNKQVNDVLLRKRAAVHKTVKRPTRAMAKQIYSRER